MGRVVQRRCYGSVNRSVFLRLPSKQVVAGSSPVSCSTGTKDKLIAVLNHDWKVAKTPRQRMLATRDKAIVCLFFEVA
jgi:hypothetical protein